MNKEQIEAIRSRCNAATPGPWSVNSLSIIHKFEDYYFIANARQDIPFLLSEVERLTRENDAMAKYLHGDCGVCTTRCGHGKYPCFCINGSAWQWRGAEWQPASE